MIKINIDKHASNRMIQNGMMISFSLDTGVPAVVRFFTYRKSSPFLHRNILKVIWTLPEVFKTFQYNDQLKRFSIN
jgi:hypothetical protein